MSFSAFPNPPTFPLRSHKLVVPSSDLDELSALLKSSRLTKQSYENTTGDAYFGVKREWAEEARRYWLDVYDWKRQEAHINTFPQYIASLRTGDGLPMDIHFAAVFSAKSDATAIVFTHGWPGCWIEFIPMMQMVMQKYTPETLPYHIIVPSLPGFTHSSPPPTSRDFGMKDTAYLWNQLMTGLGFATYVAQGGDLGSYLSWQLARDYSECVGLHVNMLNVNAPPGTPEHDHEHGSGNPDATEVIQGLSNMGYALEQATRPSAIGMVVGCSPLAILIWVGEYHLEASGIKPSFDRLLTFISLYWFTDCYSTGIWFYRYLMGNRAGPKSDPSQAGYLDKPLGYSVFPRELGKTKREWVDKLARLVYYKEHQGQGGHFAAMECPDEMWSDIQGFCQEMSKEHQK